MEPSHTLKIEVHRVGVRGLFRASRLGGDEFDVQRARKARDDFVLHVEEISQGLVEPLGPEMIARFGIDQLDIDAYSVSAALNAAFEDIANVQLAPDLLQIDGLALVGERRITRDYDRAPYAREVGREALGDPVDEMLLLPVAADIGERQDDHREAAGRIFPALGSARASLAQACQRRANKPGSARRCSYGVGLRKSVKGVPDFVEDYPCRRIQRLIRIAAIIAFGGGQNGTSWDELIFVARR